MKLLLKLATMKRPRKYQLISDRKNKKEIKKIKKEIQNVTVGETSKSIVDLTIEYIYMVSFIQKSDIFSEEYINSIKGKELYYPIYNTTVSIDDMSNIMSATVEGSLWGYNNKLWIYVSKNDRSINLKCESNSMERSYESSIIDNPLISDKDTADLTFIETQTRFVLLSHIKGVMLGIIDCYYDVYLRR